jgi:hypothetical protein
MIRLIRRTSLVLLLAVVATAGNGIAQDAASPVGDWEGVLSAMGQELTIVFHITQAADGVYAATLDSPDQGALGIPCEAPIVEGASVQIAVAAARGRFEGTISEDGSMIDGTWSQMGNSSPLVLKPVEEENEGRR